MFRLAVLLCALGACLSKQEGRVDEDATHEVDASDPGSCVLEAAPARVRFRDVRRGSTASQAISLLNVGDAECRIDALDVVGHAGFGAITTLLPARIAPGESRWVGVQFTNADDVSSTAELHVRDLGDDRLVIPLEANVGGACLAFDPVEVDLGEVPIGRRAKVDVTLTSCGDTPLVVRELSLAGDEPFAFDALPEVPFALAPDDSEAVTITLTATAPGELEATLQVVTNSAEVQTVSLHALSIEACCRPTFSCEPEVVDAFATVRCSIDASCGSGFEWHVVADGDATVAVRPSNSTNLVMFTPERAGSYEVRLTTFDQEGEPCEHPPLEVVVAP